MKVLFSIDSNILIELKKRVPARKRSQLVENLLAKYFTHQNEQVGWDALQNLRKSYIKSNDPVKLSTIDWLRGDRSNH